MFNNDLPLTPLKLEQYLAKALGYEIDFNVLYSIYTTINAGTSISNLLSASALDELYGAVERGYSIKATSTNTVVNILTAECEEVASDDFRCVTLAFIHNDKYVTLAFSRFGTSVFLDNKVVKEL